MSMLLDYVGIITDGNKAQYDDLSLNLIVADTGETFYVERVNGVLLAYPGETRESAQATVTCAKLQLFATLMGNPADGMKIQGDASILQRLVMYATPFSPSFHIIEP